MGDSIKKYVKVISVDSVLPEKVSTARAKASPTRLTPQSGSRGTKGHTNVA